MNHLTAPCADSPAPILCQLIETVQSEKERAATERAARLQTQIQDAKQFARDHMGTLWDELAPLSTVNYYDTDRQGELEYLRIELDPDKLLALDLAPFHIWVLPSRFSYTQPGQSTAAPFEIELRAVSRQGSVTYTRPFSDASVFFHAMRQRVLDARAKEMQEKIDALQVKLNPRDGRCVSDPLQAAAVFDELVALDPANTDTYRSVHAAWLVKFESDRAEATARAQRDAERVAAERARAAAHQQLANGYRVAYLAYWDALCEIHTHNVDVQTRYQAELDKQTFEVWKLEYALVAESEEGGERLLETRTAYLLKGYTANAWGEYGVLQPGGEFILRRFAHEVYCDAPETWTPSQHKQYARTFQQGDATFNVTFYLSPEHPYPANIAQKIRDEWKYAHALVEPATPDGLPKHDAGWLAGVWLEGARSIRQSIENANPLPQSLDD